VLQTGAVKMIHFESTESTSMEAGGRLILPQWTSKTNENHLHEV